jgi:hypothetical protein
MKEIENKKNHESLTTTMIKKKFTFSTFFRKKCSNINMDVDEFDDGDIEDDFQLLGDDNPEFYDDYDSHTAAELAHAKKKEKQGFVVLSKLELLNSIQKLSAEVTDSLNVSSEEAFLLLRFFK